MLTQRVIKSGIFSFSFKGELIWLENPGASDFLSEWKTHIIAEGPDVIFKSIPYKGGLALFCTEFFGDVPCISVRQGNTQGEQTAMRIIDDNLESPLLSTLWMWMMMVSTSCLPPTIRRRRRHQDGSLCIRDKLG